MPLVAPLVEGDTPRRGRDPVAPGEVPPYDLPELPEVWPYGTSSMFRDKFNDDNKLLAAMYITEHILPGFRGWSMQGLSERMRHQLHRRVGPILRTYTGRSGGDDWGGPGDVSEGEDELILELKHLGVTADEVLLENLGGEALAALAGDTAVENLERRVEKRKRAAEVAGYEPGELRLLAPLETLGQGSGKRRSSDGGEWPAKRRKREDRSPSTDEEGEFEFLPAFDREGEALEEMQPEAAVDSQEEHEAEVYARSTGRMEAIFEGPEVVSPLRKAPGGADEMRWPRSRPWDHDPQSEPAEFDDNFATESWRVNPQRTTSR